MPSLDFRRYALFVLGPIVTVSVLCLLFAAWLEPVRHDLTRLGGYTERDFGWNSPQLAFKPPIVPISVPGQAYDVVVIGDSFSTSMFIAPGAPRTDDGFWTDIFAQRTGLTVGAFHRDLLSAEDYLASAVFHAAPPRLLIIEIVERELDEIRSAGARCPAPSSGRAFHLDSVPLNRTPVPHGRDTSAPFNAVRIDTAIDVLAKHTVRWLTGSDWTDVLQLPLSRHDLFSNRRSDRLLIYKQDRRKARISSVQEFELGCYLRTLQSNAEANGYTSFLLMIVPDKSTAYADYTQAPALPNMVERLARDPALRALRLDIVIKCAVALGQKDIYLPDDTHWGWAGKQIAADALIQHFSVTP